MAAGDVTLLLVFARAAGLVSRAPGFSHPSVPAVVRAGLAASLAFAIAPGVPRVHQPDLAGLTAGVAANLAAGAALGFGASLLYDGAYHAGRTIDDYLGVRGSVPGAAVASAQAFGRLWSSAFLAAFVLLGGWIPVVFAFAASFDAVPPAGAVTSGDWLRYALALPGTFLRGALLVAAPAISVAAALQLVLAAVARVVPRFSSFTLAFPAVFGAALAVTLLTVPVLAQLGGRPWLLTPWAVVK